MNTFVASGHTSDPTAPAAPEIDVLIPAYNAASTIRQSIGSIQAQTLPDIRIIVVDDGSDDGTSELLADMSGADCRLVVLRQSNGGIVDALNAGLRLAAAPFVARHDADDIAYPHRLERQLAYLRNNGDCVAVGANAWHIGEDGAPIGSRTTFVGDVDPDPCAVPAREPYLMHPFLMVRREALEAAGGYRPCFHAEDADLYWRLLQHGRLHNLEEVLGEYRVHSGSVSAASIRNGRIAAKYAQLAALSHRRRQAGRPDIEFSRSDLGDLESLGNFRDVVEHKAARLDQGEQEYVRLASAAKLMSAASYRPFLLDPDDCRCLSTRLKDLSRVSNADRSIILRTQAEVLRRYIDAGLWRQIAALRLPLAAYAQLPRRYLWKLRKQLQTRRLVRSARAKGMS